MRDWLFGKLWLSDCISISIKKILTNARVSVQFESLFHLQHKLYYMWKCIMRIEDIYLIRIGYYNRRLYQIIQYKEIWSTVIYTEGIITPLSIVWMTCSYFNTAFSQGQKSIFVPISHFCCRLPLFKAIFFQAVICLSVILYIAKNVKLCALWKLT